MKEEVTKKDFNIKQLENKLRIVQEELRNTDQLYENEKFKMNVKVRELEELLKERYEYTSRLSQPASSKWSEFKIKNIQSLVFEHFGDRHFTLDGASRAVKQSNCWIEGPFG